MSISATPSTDARATAARDQGPDDLLEAVLTRRVWQASVRQHLLPPVSAIMDLAEMLLNDARDRDHSDLVSDLQQMHSSGRRLLALVRDLLGPGQGGSGEVAFGSDVRHDLRNPLNGLIGFCELWLEDAPDLLLEGFVPDLQAIRTLSGQILQRVDELAQGSGPEPGPGSTAVPELVRDVVASLPVRPPEGPRTDRTAPGALLVVDDTEINRNLLSRRLRREGHAVAVAEDGRRALELLRSRPFDLVLLDIIMPGLNGLQVLEQLKADPLLCHLPVIMISALDEVDSVVRCIEMGAEDYLLRPFNPVLLRARIGACLEKKRLRDREALYVEQIRREQQRSDELLHVILPGEIVKELKSTNAVRPRRHENVAVLFADIVGFTTYCDRHGPEEVAPHLQRLVESSEDIALRHGVEKIKTIGDAFMAASGLLTPADNPVLNCVRCGLEMIAAARALPTHWDLRVGVHIGQVGAGVIGRRQYLFDIWGDTVNTAARMESHGVPGHVTLSHDAWQWVRGHCRGESLGRIEVKGKGSLEMIRVDGFREGTAEARDGVAGGGDAE